MIRLYDIFILLCILGVNSEAKKFNYDRKSPKGPQNWSQLYPMCRSNNQSPINIETGRSSYSTSGRLVYNNYERMNGRLIRKDHTVKFLPTIEDRKLIGVPGMSTEGFTLHQFHLHWGRNMNGGSEHAINGKFYPAEVHLVHFNSDIFATFGQALGKNKGIVVVAVFLEVIANNTCEESDIFNPFVNCDSINIGDISPIDRFISSNFRGFNDYRTVSKYSFVSLEDLFPPYRGFYMYEGTTTTPLCYPNVTWIVIKDTLKISQKAWQDIQAVVDNGGIKISVFGNYRPVQSLGNRQIIDFQVTEELN